MRMYPCIYVYILCIIFCLCAYARVKNEKSSHKIVRKHAIRLVELTRRYYEWESSRRGVVKSPKVFFVIRTVQSRCKKKSSLEKQPSSWKKLKPSQSCTHLTIGPNRLIYFQTKYISKKTIFGEKFLRFRRCISYSFIFGVNIFRLPYGSNNMYCRWNTVPIK